MTGNNNQPIDQSVGAEGDGTKTPVFNEVSIIARQLILGNYDRLLPADDTLLTRGGGNAQGLKLYDELERDPKVWECLQKRKLALTSRNWKVEPPEGDTSRIAKKAADLVNNQLRNIGFDRLSKNMLDATNKGLSVHEIMWARDGREIVAEDALDIEPWTLQFKWRPDPDEYRFARCGVRLLTAGNYTDGEKVPHRKFMLHRYGEKYNNPWGLGLGTRLFWPVFFKRQGIQFWLSFAERFGTPVPVGKYPNNATLAEKSTLRSALRAFQQEGAIMVPAGMEITLLEAARSGIDTYERLCKYMDDQIAGIILGKSGGVGSGGQLAANINVENDVRLELVKADADILSESVVAQKVRWIVDYNMPGAPVPSVTRVVEEPEDTESMAKTRKTLFDMGFRPTLQSIQRDFGGDYTEIDPPKLLKTPASAINDRSIAEFSEPETPADQAAVDALLASLAGDQLQPLMVKILTPVIKAVSDSKDHQEALARLVDLFPNVPMDDLQESLARVIFVLDTWGRLNADADQS